MIGYLRIRVLSLIELDITFGNTEDDSYDEDDDPVSEANTLTVIVPGDDLIEHDRYGTGRCICGPKWVEIHHALDARGTDE